MEGDNKLVNYLNNADIRDLYDIKRRMTLKQKQKTFQPPAKI